MSKSSDDKVMEGLTDAIFSLMSMVSDLSDQVHAMEEKIKVKEERDTLDMIQGGRSINNRVTLDAWTAARMLRRQGLSISAVARTLNRPRSTVQYLLERSEEDIKRSLLGKRKPKTTPVSVKEDNEEILAAFKAAGIAPPEEVEEKNLALDFPDYVC